MHVRTRFAPSPTGYAHLGFVSRVLINYALSKKNGGEFIWRNEDTDRDRFVSDALEFNMKWMREYGFDWDEGPDKGGPYAPYTQSERLDLYKVAWEQLIEKDYAYKCFCTKERLDELRAFQTETKQQTKYDGKCRNLSKSEVEENLKNNLPFTVRIKVPRDRKIEFDDAITHNHITWNSNDIDDYIIVKSNGVPTYHLAAMYDDIAMKITHVFRGNEWVSTTPVHVLIYEGLGIKKEDIPLIGHFTVILDPATPGKKFSKRKSSFRVNGLLQQGYLKEAILNYLMLLGWAPKDNREIFTLEEFVQAFDLAGMQKSNPTWDQKKMDWFNGHYIRTLSLEEFTARFLDWIPRYLKQATEDELENNFITELLTKEKMTEHLNFANEVTAYDKVQLTEILKLVHERAVNFWEVLMQIEFFFHKPVNIDWNIKQLKNVSENLTEIKTKLFDFMNTFDQDSSKWDQEVWQTGIRKIADDLQKKHGDIFMVLRIAVVGSPFSPPLFECLQILGKDEVLSRIKK